MQWYIQWKFSTYKWSSIYLIIGSCCIQSNVQRWSRCRVVNASTLLTSSNIPPSLTQWYVLAYNNTVIPLCLDRTLSTGIEGLHWFKWCMERLLSMEQFHIGKVTWLCMKHSKLTVISFCRVGYFTQILLFGNHLKWRYACRSSTFICIFTCILYSGYACFTFPARDNRTYLKHAGLEKMNACCGYVKVILKRLLYCFRNPVMRRNDWIQKGMTTTRKHRLKFLGHLAMCIEIMWPYARVGRGFVLVGEQAPSYKIYDRFNFDIFKWP